MRIFHRWWSLAHLLAIYRLFYLHLIFHNGVINLLRPEKEAIDVEKNKQRRWSNIILTY